jgi:Domain of unknown function (DUF1330)
VVLEFPSYVAALACYRSSDYQAAAALRKGKAEFDLFVIEGYDGERALCGGRVGVNLCDLKHWAYQWPVDPR